MKRFVTKRKQPSSLHYLCMKTEIRKGESKAFSISRDKGIKQDIAVFNINDNFYAISNVCAHKGGPLNQGTLENSIVTCPWHGWKYNVFNGKSPHRGGDSVNSYKINVIGNKLYLDLIPLRLGTTSYRPHKAYGELRDSLEIIYHIRIMTR
jgi:Ferredoxin subunits of nitrite reductase and ring-hydroxylating dioxygenases